MGIAELILLLFSCETASKDQSAGVNNLEIWNLQAGRLVAGFSQKKKDTWLVLQDFSFLQLSGVLSLIFLLPVTSLILTVYLDKQSLQIGYCMFQINFWVPWYI